jgi:carbonic anhydrase
MRKLIKGLREFQSTYFQENRTLFEQLGHGQTPRVLFITCSDSRIDPNLILQAEPGELFVIRNAGNLVPPYGAANGGEGASIEYAIEALNITQVIICGHNHCGAMKGLLKLNELQEKLPLVYDWLKHTEATRRLLKENYGDYEGEELLDIAIAENVLTQLENLKTYPVVRSRLHQGTLHLYGWIYEIESGEILAYNPLTHAFEPPQSQLYPEDESYEQEVRPGTFVRTSAPPITAPATGTSALPPVSQTSSRIVAASPAASVPATTAGGWLSPEQADRIYRGSSRARR